MTCRAFREWWRLGNLKGQIPPPSRKVREKDGATPRVPSLAHTIRRCHSEVIYSGGICSADEANTDFSTALPIVSECSLGDGSLSFATAFLSSLAGSLRCPRGWWDTCLCNRHCSRWFSRRRGKPSLGRRAKDRIR